MAHIAPCQGRGKLNDNPFVDSELATKFIQEPDESSQGHVNPGDGLIMKAIVEMKVELQKNVNGILTSVRAIEKGTKACEECLNQEFQRPKMSYKNLKQTSRN